MKIMSVDLGLVRTGLAICDELELITSPIETVHNKNLNILSNIIINKIIETDTKMLVIGLPLNMNGSAGESAERVHKFKNILEYKLNSKNIKIEIVLWDERLSTVSAINYLNQVNIRGQKRKNIIDTVSAVIILENYLNYRKNNIKN
ncbi:MAG: Holliday junction resolvase RuvX [Clostridia bacterium]|nr:Holliday junction resolvase RuvX [Clostridia bacterium]MBQ3093519.1 Holliday junction resolvase RuvX [Clostridia bacterium]